MSKVTSPILLDSTGQEANKILQEISCSLKAANTLIDDNVVCENRVWSSKKIVDALTVETVETGTTLVSFDSIGATRPQIKVQISQAPIEIKATLTDRDSNTQIIEYVVPINGTYYLNNGRFIMEDGTETQLATHCLVAAQGTNTLEILNVDSIEVTYRTISKQTGGGGMADFEIIHGGSAKEEA